MLRSSIRLLALCVGLGLQSLALLAQPPHSRSHPVFQHIYAMKAELALTPEQEAQLKELEEETTAQRQAIQTGNYANEDARRAALREAKKNHREQVEAILTTEQLSLLRDKAREQQHARVDHKAMHAEILAYREREVRPVMRELRLRLEADIEPADQAAIAQLRQLMADKKAEFSARRQAGLSREEMHQLHKTWQETHAAELSQLEALVSKYDAPMSALLDEIADKKNQWKADEQAIRAKYEAEGMAPPHGRTRRAEGRHAEGRRDREKSHFLLLSAEAEPSSTPIKGVVSQVQGAQVAPNPATDAATLRFSLAVSQEVVVEIRDERGAMLRKLSSQLYEAGNHSLSLDLQGLQAGLYYCVVTEASGAQQSLKLMVVR